MTTTFAAPRDPGLKEKEELYLRVAGDALTSRVNQMFIWLLAAEWIALMGIAFFTSPRLWNGTESSMHPHLWIAILSGPAFILPTIVITLLYPLKPVTKHLVAAAQMLVSIVLTDVTGGRIESHFHIFGSLAFLAFYRDWRVLITASAITAVDHFMRGVWWPQSAYGLLTVSPWRWVEHAWWVVFEDTFLIIAARRSSVEMREVATSKSQLYAGAYHDVLTGLANRRLLKESFESRVGSSPNRTGAILFIDLDRFKQANDTLGHTVGDALLVLVSARLSDLVGNEGTLARVGGDEFVVMLEAASTAEQAIEMGTRLLGAFQESFQVGDHELLLSSTVGISLYPEHGSDLATLQERADRAMYVAKSRGRNQCAVFSSEIARHEDLLKDIARDLYQALPKGEFELYFQPLVDQNAQIIGFEALLRWKHPVHGLIPPSDFIGLAERSGLIVAIGDWVLAESCRMCVTWQSTEHNRIGVAVNVSALQFERPEFPERVREILRESGMDPSLLTLELTESVLVQDLKRACGHLAGLREIGVRVALDDFGTGYTSLSYLTMLPADIIKLDRSFLNRKAANTSAVVEAVIDMAHRIGLSVVGEGVESLDQTDWLVKMNCDELQGFYFSPPMPASSVQSFVNANRTEHAMADRGILRSDPRFALTPRTETCSPPPQSRQPMQQCGPAESETLRESCIARSSART